MPSERIQLRKNLTNGMIPLYEMSRVGNSVDIDSRLLVA